ncbi:efflux RND transporter periplasmic adaptor subunit [Candidatus Woesebacteria bacterium]|nr:efflux RND transporter periplasmic adaptor subunit [Candidatus Woesebacteria bacterium]
MKTESKTPSLSPFQRIAKQASTRWIILLIVLLGGAGLYWRSTQAKQSVTTIQEQTLVVEKNTLVVSVSSAGQTGANNSSSILTSATGVVKKVFVANGDRVSSGQKIAQLELDQTSQQKYTQALSAYQSAANSLSAAKANLYTTQAAMLGKWDTYKKLAESDTYKDVTAPVRTLPEFIIPQNEWLASEASYKNQQSVVAQAQTALSSASQSLSLLSPILYAPISGTVTGMSLLEGMVLSGSSSSSDTSASTSVGYVLTNARPIIRVNLTEVDATKVALNQKAVITIDALPDKSYTGKVYSIDTVGSVSSGVTTYPATIVLDSDAPDLLSNMSAQATIITLTKPDVILIPTSAVQTQDGQSSVNLLRDGTTTTQTVTTGVTSGTQIEIVSGLSEGDTIVYKTTSSASNRSSSQTTSPFSGVGGFGGAVRINR